jgi:hypothetical protein
VEELLPRRAAVAVVVVVVNDNTPKYAVEIQQGRIYFVPFLISLNPPSPTSHRPYFLPIALTPVHGHFTHQVT